jgi:hypothetical protein
MAEQTELIAKEPKTPQEWADHINEALREAARAQRKAAMLLLSEEGKGGAKRRRLAEALAKEAAALAKPKGGE